MTCAKRRVICILRDDAGREARGENTCLNPQAVCPRQDGEGYEKCKTVCRQTGHAEVNALRLWTDKYGRYAQPTLALIRGHFYVCEKCQRAMDRAGILTCDISEALECPQDYGSDV